MAAAFEAVPFDRLYYRLTEKEKTEALKNCKGNFESRTSLMGAKYIRTFKIIT